MTRYTRAQVDAALQEKALRDWTAGVERARQEYAAHPIVTKSYPCMTCTGWAYGKQGYCIPCVKEGIADVAAGSRITYELKAADKWKERAR